MSRSTVNASGKVQGHPQQIAKQKWTVLMAARISLRLMKTKQEAIGFWLAIGVAIGTGLGIAFDNIGMGTALGISLGLVIGAVTGKKLP
jgi:hypothetical protein